MVGKWNRTSSDKFDSPGGSLNIKIEDQESNTLCVKEDGSKEDVNGKEDYVLDGVDYKRRDGDKQPIQDIFNIFPLVAQLKSDRIK